MLKMKVENLLNNKGNRAVNQFVISDYSQGVFIFQSYNTQIAEIKNNKLTLTDAFDYSNTTSKHAKIFITGYFTFNDEATSKIWKDAKKGKRVFNKSDY